MALQTTKLQGILRGPDGVALAGATVRFVLSHTAVDVGSNTALVRTPVDVETDDDGSVSVDLWPNANGFDNTHYDVRAYTTDEHDKPVIYEFGQLQVPTVGPVDLADLLGAGVLRAKGVEGQVLDAAIRAAEAADRSEKSAEKYNEPAVELRLNGRFDKFLADSARSFPLAPNLLADTRKFATLCGGSVNTEFDIFEGHNGSAWSAHLFNGTKGTGKIEVVALDRLSDKGIAFGGALDKATNGPDGDPAWHGSDFRVLLLDVNITADQSDGKPARFLVLKQGCPRFTGWKKGEFKTQAACFVNVVAHTDGIIFQPSDNMSATLTAGGRSQGQGLDISAQHPARLGRMPPAAL